MSEFQLQHLVVEGELPCEKEDAAMLAGIQQHLEEAWPEEDDNDDQEQVEQELLDCDYQKKDRKDYLLKWHR